MSLVDFVRGVIGAEEPTVYVEGTISDVPRQVEDKEAGESVILFRLDSRPDLEFRQVRSPLSPERRRGERVRVHYRGAGPIANVGWIEKI